MLLLSLFLGITIATTIGALAPLYLDSLEQLAFRTTLEQIKGRYLGAGIFASNVVLSQSSLEAAETAVDEAVETHLSDVYAGHDSYVRSSVYLAGLSGRELPDKSGTGETVLRGYIQYLSGLQEHAALLDGKLWSGYVSEGLRGPVLGAAVSRQTADWFDIGVGDSVSLATALDVDLRVSVFVSGILEPADPGSDYWNNAGLYLEPTPLADAPPRGVRVDPADPPIALFVSQDVLAEAVRRSNPGTLVDPLWFIRIDKDRLKNWPVDDTLRRFDEFEDTLRDSLPESKVSTGAVSKVVEDLQRRSFFSSVPMLLLLAVMIVTVLFYMSMTASYLVQSRERDAGLLRSRGVGTVQLFRISLLEGLVLTAVAVAIAVGLSLAIVALAGKLPYFREMTGGEFMPIALSPTPFLVAAGAGVLCLLILVIPGALSARAGLLVQKLQSARPPTTSWFHRLFLDVAVLLIGGLIYWELRSRGQLISSGLFSDVQVNESLLLAPVLFLVVVALVFMRLFPLLLRYASGESPALTHVLAGASVAALAADIIYRDGRDVIGASGTGPLVVLLAISAAYWATARAPGRGARIAGLLVQGGLIAGFFVLEPPEAGELAFAAAAGLLALVPVQLIFLLLRASIRRAPVWLSVGLWHMGRNPLQYTWLVLLLVLVTGLGILATTVGGTLEKSRHDRILYSAATDLRVTGSPKFLSGGIRGLKDRYLENPGIASASLSLRTSGSVGPALVQVLGVESRPFPLMSWYRDDFSERSFDSVMGGLHTDNREKGIAIPEGATEIGAWVKPLEFNKLISLWMVLKDSGGAVESVSLGPLGHPEWHLLRAEIPPELEPPLYLSAVQIFEPGGNPAQDASGIPSGTAGNLLLDDIHVVMGPGGDSELLEDFESENEWTPIVTSYIPSDSFSTVTGDSRGGELSGYFAFGRYRNMSVRGIYHGEDGGAVPVVISSSLAAARGLAAGDTFIAIIAGRMVPAVVRDSVDYFPTMGRGGGAFIVADVEPLMSYLNMLGQPSKVELNELFINKAPNAELTASDVLGGVSAMFLDIEDSSQRLQAARLDPFSGAGWQAMVLVALTIVVLAAGFGYATYLLLFARRSRSEMGFLQCMGLSRGQLMGLLGFEHLVIAAAGVGLGTWAGFQISELMVMPLAVTETGEKVVPPFILVTSWGFMAPTYAALVAVFVGALLFLGRKLRHLDLQSIVRVADN